MIDSYLKSPNFMCRVFGCIATGPHYRMPQSHCWRCGARQLGAQRGCPAFWLPASGASWFTRLCERITTRVDLWRGVRALPKPIQQGSAFLFVYGTLKSGHGNHRLLERCPFVQHDEAPGRMFGAGVPVVAPNDTDWVKGEVYEVTLAQMRACDRLEGHPHSYTRTLVTLRSGVEAFIYYWHHSVMHRQHIENGEWPNERARRYG